MALLLGLLATGRANALLAAGPVGWGIVIAGVGLEAAGITAVALMLWKAGR